MVESNLKNMSCLADAFSVGVSLFAFCEHAVIRNGKKKKTQITAYKEIKPAFVHFILFVTFSQKKQDFSEGKINKYKYIYIYIFSR